MSGTGFGMGLGLAVEGLVTVLLGVTVGYCFLLDKRLQRFRKDEGGIRQTVVELGLATDRAEVAISGLRNTIADADHSLAERLRAAELFAIEFDRKMKSGDEVLGRIMKIVSTARLEVQAHEPEPDPVPSIEVAQTEARAGRLADTLASARAMADRVRARRLSQHEQTAA